MTDILNIVILNVYMDVYCRILHNLFMEVDINNTLLKIMSLYWQLFIISNGIEVFYHLFGLRHCSKGEKKA